MAAFYADESFPLPAVEALRRLGHDVLTAWEAGQANQRVPDDAVLEFATCAGRAVLTLNRWDFVGLHARVEGHAGIVACSQDPDPDRLAGAIDATVRGVAGRLDHRRDVGGRGCRAGRTLRGDRAGAGAALAGRTA